MAENGNGNGKIAIAAAPTEEAKKLVRKDFSKDVAILSETRMIDRSFMRRAVGDFDPEYISIPRLYQMRKDPMLQLGLHFCKFPLIRSKWHMECEDRQIGAATEEIVRRVFGSYTRTLLNKYDFGFQGGVKEFELGELHTTYEDERGAVRPVWDDDTVKPMLLEPPLPLPPEYVKVKLKDGKFIGIESTIGTGIENADGDRLIGPEWSVWMINEFEENFRNYYGYPRLGYAYRYWWSYWFRFHMEDRHFEMDADPALQIKYPKGFTTDGDGVERSNRDLALQIGDDLRGGATIAWPSETYYDEQGKPSAIAMWDASFLTGGENLSAFRESLEYLDVMKLRSVLVPEQALVEGKGGTSSRNVAATYGDIFTESLGQDADDLDDYWNRYIIPQIVEANWGPDAPKVTKVTTGFEDEDMALANELIKLAFAADPNALPINFDDLIKQAHLPIMSAKEQKERGDQLEEQKQEAMAQQRQQMEEEGGPGGEEEEGPPKERGFSLHLHRGEPTIQSTAPAWAKQEHTRREANISGLAQRLQNDLQARYAALIENVATQIEEGLPEETGKLSLAFSDRSRVKKFNRWYDNLRGDVTRVSEGLNAAIKGEVASIYQAAGAAELIRIDQEVDNWDVRREDIQDWAEQVVARVLSQSDDSLMEIHIRPYLESELVDPSYTYDPNPSLTLAQKFRVKFLKYPEWMAKRTARTEARSTYNNASLDVWELSGIKNVRAYDGLGGVTGRTDEKCLSRNGKVMSIDQAREEDAEEHPNGTLGFVPVVEETVITLSQVPLVEQPYQSTQTYSVDTEGFILFPTDEDLDLAPSSVELDFNPDQHPRDEKGRFQKVLNGISDDAEKAGVELWSTAKEIEPGKLGVVVDHIGTDPEHQGQGRASQILKQITGLADARGVPVALDVGDPEFIQHHGKKGSNVLSKAQLIQWYKRHGFVPNKGKRKHFGFRQIMIRYPQS